MFAQTTSFSCAAASLLTVEALLGVHNHFEADLMEALDVRPKVGTDTELLAGYCERNYPGVSFGEHAYNGGLAIANIRNWRCGTGHFVVFLEGDAEKVEIFDPFDGEIHIKEWGELDFQSGCGAYKHWTINFS